MATYVINGYRINLKNTYKMDKYREKYQVQYSLFSPEGKKIFSGCDLYPSPLYGVTSKKTAVALLSFLTLQFGDVEKEYFKDYTPKQLEWIDSNDAEDLRMYIYDFEDKNKTLIV